MHRPDVKTQPFGYFLIHQILLRPYFFNRVQSVCFTAYENNSYERVQRMKIIHIIVLFYYSNITIKMIQDNNTKVLYGSQDLRDRMPRGSIAMLAAKYEKSWTWIYNVISGSVKGNPEIIEDAERLAAIEDEMKTKIKSAIHNVNPA